MDKLKIWKSSISWEEAEATWDEKSAACATSHPLKTLSSLPRIPGITPDTARHLTLKSVKYLLLKDERRIFLRYFFKHPFRYGARFLRSAFKKKAHAREGDFFFYGIQDVTEFEALLQDPNAPLAIGFSYCQKPHECPSGRFSSECIHDPSHPVCRQCFIGKTVQALPERQRVFPLFIPTIHYIGEELFKLRERYPHEQLLFLITACEMTLEMFGNWGNMIGAKGIGVRLDGRICNTMRAFELSEQGVKPGLTVLLPETQRRVLDLIKKLW